MQLDYRYNWVVPLWIPMVGLIGGLAALWLASWVLRRVAPHLSAVASATAKESRSQPLFPAIIALGALFLILFSPFVPYSTFGDDIKVMKETSLQVILILSIVLSVLSAGTTIADELEGRTALTVLSKPIGRRPFILGKWLGVLATVATAYLILSAILLATTSYKVKFEARERALPAPKVEACRAEVLHTVPPVVLAFFEVVVFTSMSVAVATRLPMIPNLLICATVYIVGHMLSLIVQSGVGKLPIVSFVGQFLATVFPVLEHFNVDAAIDSGRDAVLTVGEWTTYVLWAGGYCLLYSTIMLLVALLLFEDRDLA